MMKVSTIFGPPGTGKTFHLAELAANESNSALFLSFTKAAAAEGGGRVNPEHVAASTIHSLVYNKLGLGRASVVDKGKIKTFSSITGIPFQGVEDADDQQVGDEYLGTLSYAENLLMDVEEAYDHFGRPGTHTEFQFFVKSYADWKTAYGYVDFNDMLKMGSELEFQSPPVVFLDEAQDCSPLQWKVFEKVCAKSQRVYIAGDDDQAIYEWSGADPHGMIDFSERHNADVKILDQSHRVPLHPHDSAHKHAISAIEKRVNKVFKAADRDGSVTRYSDIHSYDFGALIGRNALVLVRDKFRMREIQRALHSDRVPYRIAGGVSPFENTLADAIRGWCRKTPPTDRERGAMAKMANDSNSSWEDLRKLDWRVAFKVPTRLTEFYEAADLFAPLSVTLSTVHQAKGTEADVVLVDLTMSGRVEEGLYRDRDAEARVLYVSLTRCKHDLILCGENPLMP